MQITLFQEFVYRDPLAQQDIFHWDAILKINLLGVLRKQFKFNSQTLAQWTLLLTRSKVQ